MTIAALRQRHPCEIIDNPGSPLLTVIAKGSGKSREVLPEESGGLAGALGDAYEAIIAELAQRE